MFASVIVDIQNSEVDKVFDYLVPLSLDLKAGDRVKVPFGGRLIEGFVVGLKEQSDVPAEKIKEVFCKLDSFSAITPEMLALMDYMRDEFFLKMVDILKLFIPSGMRGGKVKSIIKDWCPSLRGDLYSCCPMRWFRNSDILKCGLPSSAGMNLTGAIICA